MEKDELAAWWSCIEMGLLGGDWSGEVLVGEK